jgi:hypothetical protein
MKHELASTEPVFKNNGKEIIITSGNRNRRNFIMRKITLLDEFTPT